MAMRKALAIVLALALVAGAAAQAAAGSVVLLTGEEGALAEPQGGLVEIGRPLREGPEIMFVSPKADAEYRSPLEITVRFLPREGNDVDLSRLRVECLKIVTIDLTDRVLPHATKEGIEIENATLPSGRHTIRVTIGDEKGGVTQEVMTVRVL